MSKGWMEMHSVICLVLGLLLPWACKAVPTIPQLQTRLGPAAKELDEVWAAYKRGLGDISIQGQQLTQTLGNSLGYGFSTTPAQLRRGLVNAGVKARFRRFTRDLFSGRLLKVSVIGTSVSWGTGATKRGTTDWVSMMDLALRMVAPGANITVKNGCMPATGSGFANMCLDHMVLPDSDLVLVEFATNDFLREESFYSNPLSLSFERLIRKLLKLQQRPAVVLLQHPSWRQCWNGSDPEKMPFHGTSEDLHAVIAQYYSLPALSLRAAWWHEAETGFRGERSVSPVMAPNGWRDLTAVDQIHPNDYGHRAMLDLVMWLVLQTQIDLAQVPLSRGDAEIIRRPLPPPMYPGNYEEPQQLCHLEDSLNSLVDTSATTGWQLVNEGTQEKKKIGLVATTPGAHLVLKLNASGLLGARVTPEYLESVDVKERTLGVMLGFLQSYSGMGVANITCEGGCACPPKEQDSYHTQRTSTTFMTLLTVVPHSEECHVVVHVLSKTSSGGHKFKVNALMASHLHQMGFIWDPVNAHEWKVHDWFDGTASAKNIDT